jgi:hypothetical protein
MAIQKYVKIPLDELVSHWEFSKDRARIIKACEGCHWSAGVQSRGFDRV